MSYADLADTKTNFNGPVWRNITGEVAAVRSMLMLVDVNDVPAMAKMLQNAYATDDFIMRPFTRKSLPAGPFYPVSRFSDGMRFGVWYGSTDWLTTVHETAYHFVQDERTKIRSAPVEIVRHRTVFTVQAVAEVHDLRGKQSRYPALLDPADYGFSQQVGACLHTLPEAGFFVSSARCSGDNLNFLRPDVLKDPSVQNILRYRWNTGTTSVGVEYMNGASIATVSVT